MARPHPQKSTTIEWLRPQLFHNAHNLLIDACILYKAKSYPTAFALAVLAFEEIGKVHLVDHVGFQAITSPQQERLLRLQELFSAKMGFNHRIKQSWALGATGRSFGERFHNGALDRLKQDAFYVGFRKGRIHIPDRISRSAAYLQIKRTVLALSETGGLAFIDFFSDSTEYSRRRAKIYSQGAAAALAELTPPRPRKAAQAVRRLSRG